MNKTRRANWKDLREIYDERAVEVASTPKINDSRITRKYAVMVDQIDRQLKGGGLILDTGCGSGPYSKYLLQKIDSFIIASDISPVMLIEAKTRIKANGNSEMIRFVASNLEYLPFKDQTFNGIICSQVIEHLLDDNRGLNELYRVLAPEGTLIISTDNKNNYISKFLSQIYNKKTTNYNYHVR